jgi:L-seryl-tRNA(Ser) seleniumtransferase
MPPGGPGSVLEDGGARRHISKRCRCHGRRGVGTIASDRSLPGAGSAPGKGIPGPVIALPGGDDARLRLLGGDPPVVARLDRDRLVVDLRAVAPADDATVAKAITVACR